MELEPFQWAFSATKEGSNLDLLLDIREGIESLPKTAATFKLSPMIDSHPKRVQKEMMWFNGAWEAPSHLPTSDARRWVNPGYIAPREFSDISVTCECGAREGPLMGVSLHDESCTIEDRETVREEIWEARRDWIETAGELLLSQEEASYRLGLSFRRFQETLDDMDFDWIPAKRRGLHRLAITAEKLNTEYGRSYPEIAEAFRINPAHLRYQVYRHREGDFKHE